MGYAKRMVSGALLFGAILAPWCAVAEDDDSFKCTIGPITKTFGQTQWLVYGCNDDKTLVIVAAPGNPGAPTISRSCRPTKVPACSAKAPARRKRLRPPPNNSNRCPKTTSAM
jgi:hypothetical protein